jgi:hypothetical protein
MHACCTQHLHLSEAEAYRRITVARAARKHAVLLTMLRDGRLHLTGIALLVPRLTERNRDAILEQATHRTKREIEELVAELSPRPDAPSLIRRLPGSAASSRPEDEGKGSRAVELVPGRVVPPSATPVTPIRTLAPPLASAQRVEPLSPGRYKVQFTASAELREKLERLEAKPFGRTTAPRREILDTDTRARTRHVPAAVRRAVRERDADRCRFVDDQGQRCSERHRLKLHHRHPFGMGGDHDPGNLGCSLA